MAEQTPRAPLIELRDIRKRFPGGDEDVEVLHGISLTIEAGECVAIMGSSGSGKSTLMHLLGCLDRASDGEYRFAGQDVNAMDHQELAWLRREMFGFVFQSYHLIGTASAWENVALPAIYAGMHRDERKARAQALLTDLAEDLIALQVAAAALSELDVLTCLAELWRSQRRT